MGLFFIFIFLSNSSKFLKSEHWRISRSQVSFLEKDLTEEAVVPSNWIKDRSLPLPHGVNTTKALKEKRQPSDDWKKYIVKSIKLQSGKRKLFLSKIILFYVKMNFAMSFRLNVGWISKCENRTMAISNMVHALLIYEISWALAESLVWSSRNMKYWFLACCFLHQPSRWLIFYEITGHITGNSLFKLLWRTITCPF